MATDMDRAMSDDSRDASLPQILDHGSISFGRFAVESLSWEKWSVFSRNRCQEELEKFKAPGLVAQKKAHFEEYYKRIRALKALRQEQETAPDLDYGDDNNVYSKSGEEQNTTQAENTISGVTSFSFLSEESINEVKMGKETSFNGGSQLHLETESMVPCADSSRSVSDESIAEIEQLKSGCNSLNNKVITRIDKCSVTIADRLEPESATQTTLPEQIESCAQSDSNIIQENDLFPDQVNLNINRCKDCTSISKVKGSDSTIRSTQRLKHDSVLKEVVATLAGNNVKLQQRSKRGEIKLSQGLKHPLCKSTDNSKKGVNSRRATFSKAVDNQRLTSISSNGQLMKLHSNSTVPRTFSLSTERQAAGSTSIRHDAPGHSDSKASNRWTGLPVHRRNMSHVQNASNLTDVSSHRPLAKVRSNVTVPRPFTFLTEKRAAAPSSTRDIAQGNSVSKASNRLVQLPVHKQTVSYMQNTAMEIAFKDGMRSTSLASRRSTNLVMSRLNQHRGHEFNLRSSPSSNDMGMKQNKVKKEAEFGQQISKFSSSPLPSFSKNGTPKSEHKKIILSHCADQTEHGRKSRRGMPCWR